MKIKSVLEIKDTVEIVRGKFTNIIGVVHSTQLTNNGLLCYVKLPDTSIVPYYEYDLEIIS